MHHILLIRHAECVMNLHLATTIGGRANDSPLTRRGRAQATALGQRLARLPEELRPRALFASTAVRARETAEAISRALREEHGAAELPVQLREGLLEIEMGEWAGKDRKATYTPEVLSAIRDRPLDFAAPGGESQREVEERVARCIESEVLPAAAAEAARRGGRSSSRNGETKPPHPAVVVAVVAHGVSIKTFLRRVLASDPRGFAAARNISLANTGVCEVAAATAKAQDATDRERWHLIRINDAAHLEGLIGEVFDEDAEEEEEEEVEASSPRLDA